MTTPKMTTPRAFIVGSIVAVAVAVLAAIAIAVAFAIRREYLRRTRALSNGDPIKNWTPLLSLSWAPLTVVAPIVTVMSSQLQQTLMTASWGSQILDASLYVGGDASTQSFASPESTLATQSPYAQLVQGPYLVSVQKCSDIGRARLLAYFEGLYPLAAASQSFRRLTTSQLLGVYRSLWWYYVVDAADTPDDDWNGPYWKDRIVPGREPAVNSAYPPRQSPVSHSSATGCTTSTARANQAWLFDSGTSMAWQWGNRIFVEPMQSTMRRGTRNWLKTTSPKYGVGGYPSNVYVEAVWFPDEHSGGYPTGCSAAAVVASKKVWGPKGYGGNTSDPTKPLYQPVPASKMPGQYMAQGPVWFYQLPGYGMFWNLGSTAYTYSYVDTFVNAPSGLGWTSSTQFPSVPSDRGGGVLGRDPSGRPKEIVQGDYVYNTKLILEFLSRTAVSGACSGGGKTVPAQLDPRTQLPGVGFCACPSGASTANCCAGTNCTTAGTSLGTQRSCDKQVAALMGVTSYWDAYGTTSPWSKTCVPSSQSPAYPVRRLGTTRAVDNRYLVTGWVQGNFYGYPVGDCTSCRKDALQSASCLTSKAAPTPPGKQPEWCNDCNAYRGGVPGYDPVTRQLCYGRHFSEDDPLTYYDAGGNAIYTTWYGKPLAMAEQTALVLFSEMYSCGDTGWENANVNWPFGSYFGYGQDLGGVGKALWTQAAYANPGYAINSVQFTMTPTSYSSETSPAYDNELMYFPIAIGAEASGTCASCVTLDVAHDTAELAQFAAPSKGSRGGFFSADSSTVQNTATPFAGTQMKVSNWTSLGTSTTTGSFTVGQPNTLQPSTTNILNAATSSGCSVVSPPATATTQRDAGSRTRLQHHRRVADSLVSYREQPINVVGPEHGPRGQWKAPGW